MLGFAALRHLQMARHGAFMNETSSSTRNILLISDDQATVSRVSSALEASRQMFFSIERCHRLADGIDRLAKPGIAAILLDTDLPDSQGMETVERLLAVSNKIPLLVLGRDGQDGVPAARCARLPAANVLGQPISTSGHKPRHPTQSA